ncbi:MAG: DUF115 domain-containing protein [Treponema sp.]|nr:DUF115 domain-containing protein [Treponema sp.]
MKQEKIHLLHSRYNPQAEADRFINSLSNSLSLGEKTRFFILIEPGLGYMVAPLKKKVPGAKIVALHAQAHESALSKESGIQPPDSFWYPEMGISLQDFLEREIPDTLASEIRILEWRPALAVYGGEYLALIEKSAEFIKRIDASARTFNAFGKRWFRNFFKNLHIMRTVLRPPPLSIPLVVAGSGPSLEDTIPIFKEGAKNDEVFVLAASSSYAALAAAGVRPQMTITTDGGQWALFHLFECFRSSAFSENSPGEKAPVLAVLLTAALPSQCAGVPILPVSDGSLWQTLVLKEMNIPFVTLPQRGTVSASALDLAFTLTSGDIFIAGLDLDFKNIRCHARPYAFDRFLEESAFRLSPVHSQAFKRTRLLKAGGSYGIYAAWFKNQMRAYPRRLYSLGKNNEVFDILENKNRCFVKPKQKAKNSRQEISSAFMRQKESQMIDLKFEDSPSVLAFGILEKALQNPLFSAPLKKDLCQILKGGKADTSDDELKDVLREYVFGERA